MRRRRETPIKRVNPSGQLVWMARWTDRHGRRHKAGTFGRKHDAQDAIDAAYEAEEAGVAEIFGAYAETWTARHPRGERTNRTNAGRLRQQLDVEIEGRALRDWPIRDLRRRHAIELVGVMLTVQGRATTGAQNVLRSLSAMAEDAITDDVAEVNWVRGVKVRASDPRATKERREPRVLSFEAMHAFASHAGAYEPAVRCLSDCGLRLGELLGLERANLESDVLKVTGNAHQGVLTPGDQPTKRHVRSVPISPSLAEMLRAMPPRIDSRLLFPTLTGKLWRERNFYRDVWYPAQEAWAGVDRGADYRDRRAAVLAAGKDCTPHDFRHSWVTHLRAAGIDPADLAQVAGHTVETATARYTHALSRSDDAIRRVLG